MPSQGLVSDDFSVDHSTNTIRFERRLSVSPEEAFDAWTQPDQVKCWWDPDGQPLERCNIDLRVGGGFAFATASHTDRPFAGVYRTISRPELLVFDAAGAEGRVSLTPDGDGTQMIVEIICSGPEHLKQFMQMGVADGTSRTLDNLVAYKGDQGRS